MPRKAPVEALLSECESLTDAQWALAAHRYELLEPFDSFSPRVRQIVNLRPDARRRHDAAKQRCSQWWDDNRPGHSKHDNDYLALCSAVTACMMRRDLGESLSRQMSDPLRSVLGSQSAPSKNRRILGLVGASR